MSMSKVKNKVHKNGFDLTSKIGFTAKVGEILPVNWQMVHPNETFKLDLANFTRTTPVNTAAYTRLREYVDVFFIPLRLLWDKFPQFVVQTNQPVYAQSLTNSASNFSTQPYITDADIQNYFAAFFNQTSNSSIQDLNGLNCVSQCYKLLDALGYSPFIRPKIQWNNDVSLLAEGIDVASRPTSLNVFPLCAYQKIYSDYFRFQQWENSKPYTYNFDFVLNSSSSHLSIGAYTPSSSVPKYSDTLFELHYANYHKDYNMGQMPNSQFGDVALAGPVLGQMSFSIPSRSNSSDYLNVSGGISQVGHTGSGTVRANFQSSSSTDNTSGISVLAIRQAVALQKWKEITQASGFDYKSQIQNHWNVNVSDLQSDKCIRVGGYTNNINISEVVNQALTPSSPANIAGKGVSSGSRTMRFRNNTNEFGILMTVYHAVPLLDYAQDAIINRNLLKVSATDYAIPEFDSIGMQETYGSELCVSYDSSGLDLGPSGYAPRYAELKQSRDVVRGGFAYGGGFDDWVSQMSYNFLHNRFYRSGGINLDYRSFKIAPQLLNSIFLSQVGFKGGYDSTDKLMIVPFNYEDDQLLINFLDGVSAVRPFSRTGLPF